MPTSPSAPLRDRAARRRRIVRIALIAGLFLAANVAVYLYLAGRSVPRRVRRLDEEAGILLRLGKAEEAARALEQARSLAPDEPAIAVRLAAALDAAGRPAEAESVLRQAVARSPHAVPPAVVLARRLLAAGAAAEASELLEPLLDSIRARPPAERADGLLVAGRAAAASGRLRAAQALLDEAAAAGAAGPAALALGEAQAEAGDLEAAERSLRSARLALPDDPAPAVALARVLELFGRRDEAIRELEAERAKRGDAAALDLLTALGDLLVRAARAEDARALADGLAGDPRAAPAAAYIQAAVALAGGDDALAEAWYERMAELLPRAAGPRVLAARVAARRGDVARARRLLKEAAAAEPARRDAELALLALDESAGDLEAVRARAERLLADPGARGAATRALLAVYAKSGDAAGARARLDELRRRFPRDGYLRVLGAVFAVLAGDPQAGAAELTRAVEEEPGLPGVFAALAAAREASTDVLEAIEQLAALAARDPRFAGARLALARIYERLGRTDLAVRELDAAIAERPSFREARLARARLAEEAGDLARAKAELAAVRAANRGDGAAAYRLAELEIRGGEGGAAVALLSEVVAARPGDALALARLARARALAGDAPGALEGFEAARRLDPRLAAAHEDGALLLALGRTGEARDALARALERTGDRRFAAALAAAHAILGDPERALEPVRSWRGRAGREPEGALVEAIVIALAGDGHGAKAAAATAAGAPREVRAIAAATRPGAGGAVDPGTRFVLESFALAALGWEVEASARAARVAGEAAPGALVAWWALRSLGRRGDPAVRVALARRFAEAAPGEPAARLALAAALDAAGDAKSALEVLRARPFDDPAIALALGMAYERGGDRARALELYAKAVEDDRAPAAALNNFAYLLAGSDPSRLPVAIEHARRAVALEPAVGEFQDTLGWLLYLDGRLDEAIAALARAAAAVPANPTIRYHFAVALDARGEPARAANHLRAALLSAETFPEAAWARELEARLSAELGLVAKGGPPDAPAVGFGEIEGTLDASGLAVLRLAPPPEGAREARLRYRGPAAAASVVSVVDEGGRTSKRIEARAGEEVVIERLALPGGPGGGAVLVRARGEVPPGARFQLALGPVDLAAVGGGEGGGPALEVEPNDDERTPATLAPGGALRGVIDGPGDRDRIALGLAPGDSASVTVAAREGGDLALEVIEVRSGAAERVMRRVRVPAGREASLERLCRNGRAGVALRLAAVGPAAGPRRYEVAVRRADLGPAGGGAAPDPEPNDRIDAALSLTPGRPAAGTVGPFDPQDWYRLAAGAGEVLAIRLRGPAALEIWERTSSGAVPLRVLRGGGARAGEVGVARWRVPRTGELFLTVAAAAGAEREAAYELAAERAAAPEAGTAAEIEPNDGPALADGAVLGLVFRGVLDVPRDRDWIRVAPPDGDALLAFRLSASKEFAATVAIYALGSREARFLAAFDAAGGALDVPAMRAPAGESALALLIAAPDDAAPGAYELAVTAGRPAAGLPIEVEPNDEVGSEMELRPGQTLAGRISGRGDRDAIAIGGRATVKVCAMGRAAIAVRRRGEAGAPRVVRPGESAALAADPVRTGEMVVIELLAPGDAPAAERAAWIEQAAGGAAYEVSVESADR